MCKLKKKERSKKVMKFHRFLEITLDLECLKNTCFYTFWYSWWLAGHLKSKEPFGLSAWV